MLTSFFTDRFIDLKRGLITVPKRSDILFSLVVFLLYMAVAVPIGFGFGFFKPGVLTADTWIMITLPVSLFFIPSLFEEVFFRGFLLPHRERKIPPKPLFLSCLFSIAAFIGWHPLNAMTINPLAYPLFTNPVFLCLAALLAVACTITYLKTGSLWVPIGIHWLTVLAWVFFLGGRNCFLDIARY